MPQTLRYEHVLFELDEVIETTRTNKNRLRDIMTKFVNTNKEKEETRQMNIDSKNCK